MINGNWQSGNQEDTEHSVMGSKAIAYSTLVFRILTLLFTVACIVVFITDRFSFAGATIKFQDSKSYRFVFSAAVIGAAYTVLQFPLAVYFAYTRKRLIQNGFLPEFDFYGDKLISFLLASGVGAGFAVTFEVKELLDASIPLLQDVILNADELKSTYDKFLNRVYIAVGLLSGGFVCMAILSVLSSINKTTSKGFFK